MLKNICRVCGRYAAYKRSLKIFSNQTILSNIQLLSGLMLENADFLPDLICICCQTELREAIRFRERVIEAQHELLRSLSEEQLQEIPIQFRESIMTLVNDSNNKISNISDVESEAEISNEPEVTNEEIISSRDNKSDGNVEEEADKGEEDLMEYDIIIDDNIIRVEADSENIETYDVVDEFVEEPQFEIAEEVSEDIETNDFELSNLNSEEYEVLDRVLNDDIALAQNPLKKKRGRKAIGTLVYICDECGNHISGRLAFELHCRRHRGDKQFACSECQDRFCTSSELKRHMRKHTGERPFACQHCGRCFTDYSTRVKHERTHTNERPFACTSCGKAFTTAYILKNHMLIHSGERAFRCELCDKSFIRQTHLVTHCRSSAHKRNLARLGEETIQVEYQLPVHTDTI